MRYPLRTLLIVLALGPPILAFWWWMYGIGLGVFGAIGLIIPTISLVTIANYCLDTVERWCRR